MEINKKNMRYVFLLCAVSLTLLSFGPNHAPRKFRIFYSPKELMAGSSEQSFIDTAIVAKVLRYDNIRIGVIGHCIPNESTWLSDSLLTLVRVTLVKDYLVKSGIHSDRIWTENHLSNRLLYPAEPEKNAYVEFLFDEMR